MNVGDEYMGGSAHFGEWRDTHLQIVGPAAQFAQLSFAEDWKWATGQIPPVTWNPVKSTTGTQDVLLIPSGPADKFETCTLFYLTLINGAEKRLWIASPYFVPDEQIMSALKLAALKGVDVRVLIPKNNDSKIVELAMLSFLDECEISGIKVLEFNTGFMHQKVMLVDDDVAAIGTANFDNRSFRLNFEITALVKDEDFASQVNDMLTRDMQRSSPKAATDVTSASLPFRISVQAARLLAPIL